jgi:serine/threonine-protein kinase
MSRQPKFFIPRADRRLGDRYELLECLGDGSYGWVWRSQRLEDNRIVALKIPKQQGARNKDLAEGSALAVLRQKTIRKQPKTQVAQGIYTKH